MEVREVETQISYHLCPDFIYHTGEQPELFFVPFPQSGHHKGDTSQHGVVINNVLTCWDNFAQPCGMNIDFLDFGVSIVRWCSLAVSHGHNQASSKPGEHCQYSE